MSPTSLRSPRHLRGIAVPLAACATALGAAAPAHAQPADARPSLYLQAGAAPHHTDTVTLGATLPWSTWQRALWGGQLRGYWDFYVSRWSFDGIAGYDHATLLGVTPTLRLRPDQGRSAWFWEAGVGATVADHRYRTANKEFSTRFNFASHLGVGVSLGTQRQHELVLRVQHVSNAGIKKPNPGENAVQLRYAYHF